MYNRILAFAAVCATASAIMYGQAPKLEVVGGETYNWGKVKAPTSGHLEASIQMKNTGGGILKIIDVKPSCGCTKTDPDKFILTAGEVSTMGVKLNVSPSQSGQLSKNVTIRWGDSIGLAAKEAWKKMGTLIPAGVDTLEHTIYLNLRADITKALLLSPNSYFSFIDLKLGQEASTSITLKNSDSIPVTLSDFKTDGPIVSDIVGAQTIKPGQELKLTVRIVPATPGNITGGLKFKTTHPDHPEMDVRAYGAVVVAQSPIYQQTDKAK